MIDPETEVGLLGVPYGQAIRELAARALAASGLPREAVSASALPSVDPTVDEVVQIDGGGMLVRRGDVVTAYPGRFE